MGSYINFSNRVHISDDIALTDERINMIVQNPKIEFVQISEALPAETFSKINKIFRYRPDIYFRVLVMYGEVFKKFDLSVFHELTDVENFIFDMHLQDKKQNASLDFITGFSKLRRIRLNVFDWYDYSFICQLPHELEELHIHADTMSKAIDFDCKWLLQYENLKSLYLGKKAKKNMKEISKLKKLRNLYLRAIKVNDFSFLYELPLDSFHLLYCGNNELSQLSNLSSLKEIELWRIMKLSNVDFLSELTNLERIMLQDLTHITTLPDLSKLHNLKEIFAYNVPLDLNTIDNKLHSIIKKTL